MKPHLPNGALEPGGPVQAYAERRLSGLHRRKFDCALQLLPSIHPARHPVAVIPQRDPTPPAGGVSSRTVKKRQSARAREHEGVEGPLPLRRLPDLQKDTVADFILHVKKPLFGPPTRLGPDQHLDRELRQAGQWIDGHDQSVVRSVKLHEPPAGILHDLRRAEYLGRTAGNGRRLIELPHNRGRWRSVGLRLSRTQPAFARANHANQPGQFDTPGRRPPARIGPSGRMTRGRPNVSDG